MFTKRILLSKTCQDLAGCQKEISKQAIPLNSFIHRICSPNNDTSSRVTESNATERSLFIDESTHRLRQNIPPYRLASNFNTRNIGPLLANNFNNNESRLNGSRSEFSRQMSTASEPRVIATPRVCMHDVKTAIKVEGLSPNQPVTVRMSLTEDRGKKFCSYAHFVSDKDGNVDLSTMPSLGGTYTGLVPSGLLMSLKPAPGEFKYARLLKDKIEEPLEIDLSVHNEHGNIEDGRNPIGDVCKLKRYFTAPGTKVIEIENEKVYGRLFVPPGPGPFPGVIDMYGGAGGLIMHKAALLSSHGLATIALPFFNYKDLPKSMDDLKIEYLEAATEYLTSYENVIPDRCGVLGHCHGASLGLLMASWIDKVKAVVSVNGSAHLFYAKVTRGGNPIFQGHTLKSGLDGMKLDKDGVLVPDMVPEDKGMDSPALIPIYGSSLDTNFYFAYSDGDSFKFYKGIKYLTELLDRAGNKNYTVDIFKGAGHFIEAPYVNLCKISFTPVWPSIDMEEGPSHKGVVIEWGGDVESNCKMQEDYWPKAIQFLKHNIRDKSNWYQDWMKDIQRKKVQ